MELRRLGQKQQGPHSEKLPGPYVHSTSHHYCNLSCSREHCSSHQYNSSPLDQQLEDPVVKNNDGESVKASSCREKERR
ncbi:hypothetical protein F2Q69_00031029 [Brassica cretica]|uniref:Uncharacterized protein n=1 Tax=Brassica cretica TaxID=69181 RepID=A0A8S9RTR7_BRACR|nr:hypothetical protein F2Q69_00031029 [Brassica cretica]